MKVALNIIIIFSLLFTFGCNRCLNFNDEPYFNNGIEITETIDFGYSYSIFFGYCATPPISYHIYLKKDTLTIGTVYGGGCKEHYFYPKGFYEQNNLIIWFTHDGNGDDCMAIIHDEISQDMTGIEFDSLFVLNPMDSSRIYVR